MKLYSLTAAVLFSVSAFAQTRVPLELNKSYTDVPMQNELSYSFKAEKGGTYLISVQQQGIDVVVAVENGADKLEKDSPNGSYGLEELEYTSATSATAGLTIKRLEEQGNPASGKVSIHVKMFTKRELKRREEIRKELAADNAKNVLTIDIDHFWEAFDKLSSCKTHVDSVAIFQTVYLDRASDGLIDLIKVREFTAEKFVKVVHKYPLFYNSIRANTLQTKNAAPIIEEVFQKFKALYPNFKPFKVCFAVGMLTTGGTVSDKYVLIGSEISTSTSSTDLSEMKGSALARVMAEGSDVVIKLKNIVSHECVHTQQITSLNPGAVRCNLLYAIMREGFCDFIGEQISGSQINTVSLAYGDKHEKELWTKLKAEMCSNNTGNWMYNFSAVTDKPADLGYYMGYTIAREYYKNAADKHQAIADIIEMNNPLRFLEESRYDQKAKE